MKSPTTKLWKKGRGRLGPFVPLHGTWFSESDSEMGHVRCTRTLEPFLAGSYLRLDVRWEIGSGATPRTYDEHAVIGAGDDGNVWFWSFTSDGKKSQGWLADVTDLHPEAIGFEADMPAGRARMAYWPEPEGGFRWVVESKTRKGWTRFVEHIYRQCT
jgi:hypothetical protein